MSKVYVGTYHKYNNGSIDGDWLDLSEYSSKQDFLEACAELHKDENDPELMFQDWEDIPLQLIGESYIDEKTWDWLELSESERQTVALYLDEIDCDAPIETALECYDGEHDSEQDWARDYWDQSGLVSQLPDYAQNYIDYDQFARDARMGGDMVFVRKRGKVAAFRRR